ncbi:MAG: patatin-like phospholipase family protein [Candidatus Thiodiazotropha sp. (ex Myrtea spinifera)]|nr:patatin-like phospholipase family protein [Candidatus Thiodiazotropha sp. (ex Myrtea spinifera)]MCU7828553.1 patatin-like phospholipase family protein [Candidatus Thiodiazotropha sp. (ex Myrtea sp. 'scaly one' KF741663)]
MLWTINIKNTQKTLVFLSVFALSICSTAGRTAQDITKPQTGKTIILAIDGGGIKGVIPAIFIQHIESSLRKPSYQLFDVIGGTSTGGIISAALTTPRKTTGHPYAAEEIVNIYRHDGDKIFLAQDCKVELCATYYADNGSGGGVEPYLQKMYGPTVTLASSRDKMQSVPGNRVKHMFTTSYIVNNSQDKASKPVRAQNFGPYLFNWFDAVNNPVADNYYAWEAARATSAAPTYFPIANVGGEILPRSAAANKWVVDGGTMSNNPAIWGVTEALRTGMASRLEDIIVISLGTGIYKGGAGVGINSNAVTDIVPVGGNWSTTPWMVEKLDDLEGADHNRGVLMSIVLDAVQTVTNSQLTALKQAGLKYYRLEPELTYAQSHMDNIHPRNIQSLIATANAYIKGEGAEIFKAILNDLQ